MGPIRLLITGTAESIKFSENRAKLYTRRENCFQTKIFIASKPNENIVTKVHSDYAVELL